MTDRELMQQALDLLDDINQCSLPPTGIPLPAEIDHVMEALRARLAQPEQEQLRDAAVYGTAISKGGERIDPASIYKQSEQEPVAWVECDGQLVWNNREAAIGRNLYTAPPQREWQTLTENEIKHLWYEACQTNLELTSQLIVHLARNIEAKLKEKNT